MKRYILNITLLFAALLSATFAWGADVGTNGTWSGGTLANNTTYKLAPSSGNTVTLSKAITVPSGASVTIDLNGCILKGGALEQMISVTGTLTIKDSRPTIEHKGSLNGKGLWYPNANGNIILKGGTICATYTNETTQRKGISVTGYCTVEYANIVGCYATNIGSAVTATSTGYFTMKGGQVCYNYTKSADERSGAVYGEPKNSSNSGSSINISNTTLSYNIGEGWGGAICGFNITLSNSKVIYNESHTSGGGVAVRAAGSSLLISDNCEISHNKAARNGGGIFATNESTNLTVSIVDSKINYNEAVGTGGGICIDITADEAANSTSECNISGTEINYNFAGVTGGGIYSKAETKISSSKINFNRAMTTKTAEQTSGSGRGGGFCISYSMNNELIDTEVYKNACLMYGGGGQVDHGAVLTMTGTTAITYNESVLHGAGGLHLTSNATLILNSGRISYNKCYTVGGAIHTSYGCGLELNGGEISYNTANQRGGGIHINTGGSLVLNGTNITNNTASRGKDLVAAEVYIDSDGIRQWRNLEFNESSSSLDADGYYHNTGYGGGVLIDCGSFTMNSGKLSNNSAEIGGGGLALVMIRLPEKTDAVEDLKPVQFIMTDGEIKANTSTGSGAGVYIMKNKILEMMSDLSEEVQNEIKAATNYNELITTAPSVTINNGVLVENITSLNGGAIYLQSGNFAINNSVSFSNNSATNGGGVYLGGGTFTVNGSGTFSSNTATDGSGGGVYLGDGEFVVNSGKSISITGNKATNGSGGGVYCAGTFNVQGTATIENNTAVDGGGVCVSNGAVTLKTGTIRSNTASANGGGLHVVNNNSTKQTVSFNGGTFTQNKAKAGGAVSVNGNMILTLNASMEENTAEIGGGIYMVNGVEMRFNDGLIRKNHATTTPATGSFTASGKTDAYGVGGGIFLGGNSTLDFRLRNADGTPQNAIPSSLGIYNNTATNAGADICANGNGTTIYLPNTNGMDLTGFDVPGNMLYWVEDYFTGDTGYVRLAGKESTGGVRYEDALRNSTSKINYLDYDRTVADEPTKTITQYACLDLGYDLVFVKIHNLGLLLYDDVAVAMTPKDDAEVYTKVLFTGTSEDGSADVVREVGLPSGEWKFDVTSWGFKYADPTITTTEQGTIAKDGYIMIAREDSDDSTKEDQEVEIKYTLKETVGDVNIKNILESSVRVTNVMRPKQ